MNSKKNAFSVCMSVYRNDCVGDLQTAIRSVFHQTRMPSEIILVIDGPVSTAMQQAIQALREEISILRVIPLEQNMGHAVARQTGLEAACHELCAVMDADDIAVPDRFEKQLKAFEEYSEVSVVGGLIHEFISKTDNVVGTRIVPEYDADIKDYMKSRCPMNFVTVMLKKSDVVAVGGFLDWYCEEDYYLWIRMALAGCKFYNIQENLVNVRVGEEMYQRRGGWRYFKSEASIQRLMWKNKLISLPRFGYNVLIRFIVQVVLPNGLRGWVFRHFARK